MTTKPDETETQNQTSESTQKPLLSRVFESIFSSEDNNNNVMMAAIVSLVVVVLFVLILHLYARTSFHSRRRRSHRRRRIRLHNHDLVSPPPPSSFVLDLASGASKGLDPAAIARLPLFVSDGGEDSDECVICLSDFDSGEIGRRLPKCGHEFHVECIDMWLGSHSNCPICRAPVIILSNSDSDSPDLAEIVADPSDLGGLAIEIGGGDEDINNGGGVESGGCSSSSSFGSSLMRILSRNRSERKVSPATSAVVNSTDQSTE